MKSIYGRRGQESLIKVSQSKKTGKVYVHKASFLDALTFIALCPDGSFVASDVPVARLSGTEGTARAKSYIIVGWLAEEGLLTKMGERYAPKRDARGHVDVAANIVEAVKAFQALPDQYGRDFPGYVPGVGYTLEKS